MLPEQNEKQQNIKEIECKHVTAILKPVIQFHKHK